MYAILESGGKQYRVSEGDVICVEKLPVEAGDSVELDKVLLLSNGEEVKVGTPYVEGAKVSGTVVENGKGKKVIVFKYKSKKDYRKKQGHRQPYTMIKIDSLCGAAAEEETK
ncbi:MAG: 50S ribosomal protein L21 [Firmicutes bacterium]|nr:50S ribosomal protein L21 [Bacillota bacterium]